MVTMKTMICAVHPPEMGALTPPRVVGRVVGRAVFLETRAGPVLLVAMMHRTFLPETCPPSRYRVTMMTMMTMICRPYPLETCPGPGAPEGTRTDFQRVRSANHRHHRHHRHPRSRPAD